MKIWTLHFNDDEPATIAFSTADAANAAASEWVTGQWAIWKGTDNCPDNWEGAHDVLSDQAGFTDSLTLSEHDISAHPAAAQARGALNNCVDQLNLLADLAKCDDEDVENAILDANTALEMLEK